MDAFLRDKAERLAREMASQATTLDDRNGLMRAMMKSAIERMLHTERDHHLKTGSPRPSEDRNPSPEESHSPPAATKRNRRNGHSQKTGQGDLGALTLETPRDRQRTFEPKLIPKHQQRIPGFDAKILALYAKGMTTRDIQEIVKDLYDVEVSPTLIAEITADLDAEVTAWRTRTLDPIWPIVYLDGLVVHVRGENSRVSQPTMYVAMGVNLQGKKALLGLWLAETEGAKCWLSCLTDVKNRGVTNLILVCVDGLSGFPEAIRTAFPQARVQLCLVHLVWAALRYVTEKDSRPVAADLKTIDQSATVLEAEQALETFAERRGREGSDDYQTVAAEVARPERHVRLPPADPQSDLHHQCDRVGEQRDPEVHPQPQAVPECRVGL